MKSPEVYVDECQPIWNHLQTGILQDSHSSIQGKSISHITSKARALPEALGEIAPTDSGYASMHPSKQARIDDLDNMMWETRTLYSTTSVETTRRDTITQNFACQLFNDLGGQRFTEPNATALINVLPELLADFALRLGQMCSTPLLRETMVFIHKYRRYVHELLVEIPRCSWSVHELADRWLALQCTE